MADPVQRDGTWWTETKDGDWLSWDPAAHKWAPVTGPPPPPVKEPSARSIAGFALAHWTSGLAVLGLAVYAVVRVGHDRFYARLHVTPEEVGLNQTLILSRAALYLLLSVSGVIAVMGLSTVIAFVVDWLTSRSEAAPNQAFTLGTGVIIALSLIVVAATVWYFLPPALTQSDRALGQEPHWLISQGALIVVAVLAVTSVCIALMHWVLTAQQRRSGVATRRVFDLTTSWTTTLAAASLVFASLVVSGRYGFVQGDDVAQGLARGPGPNGIFSVSATRVCVEWLDDDAPAAFAGGGPEEFMYLGQANGVLVLYEPFGIDTPLRIPTGKVAMTQDFNAPAC